MSTPIERFDEVETRFTKLFAGAVLALVSLLIIADIFDATLSGAIGAAAAPTPLAACRIMEDGTRICDIPPPQNPADLNGARS